jgi:hypothetical protein
MQLFLLGGLARTRIGLSGLYRRESPPFMIDYLHCL